MKKITLLMMLFVASIGINAQTWDFTSQTDWVGNAGGTLSTTTFSWVTDKKPKLEGTNLSVDATTNKILSITLTNNTEITELKLRHLKSSDASENRYVKFAIDANNSENKTYYFNLTNAEWDGTQNEIDFIMSVGGSKTTSNASMAINKVEFIASIPTTEKHVFNFDTDGDSEGWNGVNSSVNGPASGIITFTPVVNKYAKLEQSLHYVVADDYNWVRIKMKNKSTGDNELTLITSLGRAHIALTTSDATEQTYEIFLDSIGIGGSSGVSTWTGNAEDIVLRLGDITTGVSTGTGAFEINSIEFYQAQGPALSNQDIAKDDTQLSIYPNPVRNTLTVKASAKVKGLQIYNVTGQEVLRASEATINTSTLSKGVYIIRVSQEGGAISTKRFIKE